MTQLRDFTHIVQYIFQRIALALFLIAAVALTFASAMAAFGLWNWISLPLEYNGAVVENAGMYAQLALTALAIGLCFFLPTNRRVMQLENSHRQFAVGMQDVARAYAAVHAADRAENFQLSSEFDSVRERLAYLRDHPDLSTLEPAVLEMAAQMSHVARDLAEVYSDDKIARARSFLKQRQEEVELFNDRLDQAKAISTEMKHWLHEVELEESVAIAQLERLRDEMQEIMPELGMERVVPTDDKAPTATPFKADPTTLDNIVIDLPPKAAE
ncbi:DNA repair protein [Sulfitobacter sp. S0837]|uniref:DNA repair protein n=1 Tax=Sulfitobacter maritimus TaxID=2741719 RepID=UPI0015819D87|nr:DNA repair protein [Sulfitobacter maritimus]NUH64518.1 DNA repair protein [Sulfitobacter maritimus]